MMPMMIRIRAGKRPSRPAVTGRPRAINAIAPYADFAMINLHVILSGFESVDASQRVGQRRPETRDLVVLVVHAFFEVGDAIAKRLVLVFDHIVCKFAFIRL